MGAGRAPAFDRSRRVTLGACSPRSAGAAGIRRRGVGRARFDRAHASSRALARPHGRPARRGRDRRSRLAAGIGGRGRCRRRGRPARSACRTRSCPGRARKPTRGLQEAARQARYRAPRRTHAPPGRRIPPRHRPHPGRPGRDGAHAPGLAAPGLRGLARHAPAVVRRRCPPCPARSSASRRPR